MIDPKIKALGDIEVLALTIIGEARGETIEGQVAVGSTIRNRMKHDNVKYRDYSSVCLEPRQFSCWNEDDPNYSYLLGLCDKMISGQQITDPYLRQCILVAKGIIDYDIPDNVNGAKFYMTNKLLISSTPRWALSRCDIKVIGNQTFFNI